jgi:hypothetical protein
MVSSADRRPDPSFDLILRQTEYCAVEWPLWQRRGHILFRRESEPRRPVGSARVGEVAGSLEGASQPRQGTPYSRIGGLGQRETGRSAAQTRKLLTSLSTIVADAQERGLATHGSVRDAAYPQFCAEVGWEQLPWHGRDGVGKHLAQPGGARSIRPDEHGKPTRCYAIPAAVVELVAHAQKRA